MCWNASRGGVTAAQSQTFRTSTQKPFKLSRSQIIPVKTTTVPWSVHLLCSFISMQLGSFLSETFSKCFQWFQSPEVKQVIVALTTTYSCCFSLSVSPRNSSVREPARRKTAKLNGSVLLTEKLTYFSWGQTARNFEPRSQWCQTQQCDHFIRPLWEFFPIFSELRSCWKLKVPINKSVCRIGLTRNTAVLHADAIFLGVCGRGGGSAVEEAWGQWDRNMHAMGRGWWCSGREGVKSRRMREGSDRQTDPWTATIAMLSNWFFALKLRAKQRNPITIQPWHEFQCYRHTITMPTQDCSDRCNVSPPIQWSRKHDPSRRYYFHRNVRSLSVKNTRLKLYMTLFCCCHWLTCKAGSYFWWWDGRSPVLMAVPVWLLTSVSPDVISCPRHSSLSWQCSWQNLGQQACRGSGQCPWCALCIATSHLHSDPDGRWNCLWTFLLILSQGLKKAELGFTSWKTVSSPTANFLAESGTILPLTK